MGSSITADELKIAHKRIKSYIHNTPVLHSTLVDEAVGGELYFKCENLQKIGAFKIRGAMNALLQLPEAELQAGVCTHSSGNHAQAVARGAQLLGVPAYIVMPTTAPAVKKAAVLGYQAEVIDCEPTLEARETTARAVIDRTGATFLHPYDDPRIIAGQSTAAQELMAEVPDLDIIMAPVGGGGLLSGTALAAHFFGENIRVWAAEPHGADDAYRSVQAGHIIPSVAPQTIADGLLTSLGQHNFPIIQEYVEQILLAEEATIDRAMRLIWERMKIVVEPSAAVPLAGLMDHYSREELEGKKIGIILSGGNVDLGKLPF